VNVLNEELYCRPCGRTVWEETSNLPEGDVGTIERVYLADGSIRETAFEHDEDSLNKLSDLEKKSGWLHERASVWPAEKMKVRIFSADEVRAAEVSCDIQKAREAIYALRGHIVPHDRAWEKIAVALAEASGFSVALSKTAPQAARADGEVGSAVGRNQARAEPHPGTC
jgi:hypothetical protein